MKIRISRKLKQMASALLVVMVLGGILCVCVMYYLSLIQQQNTLSVRSQAWNIAIAVTEAGIEEGMQQLNSGTADLTANGWSYDGTYYWRTNKDAGLGDNWYTVALKLSNPSQPEIISRAYVAMPLLAQTDSSVFFAAAGVNLGAGTLTRAVRVKCSRGNLFTAAMVAKHGIDLKGNGILTDSFDSEDLWKSNFGLYDASLYAGDKGDIASNDGVVSTISVGQANIYGKAHTGAEGTVTIGSQGAVGTHAWQAGHKGFQPGYVLHDANFTFPDTSLPYSTGLPLGGPQTIVTVTYDYNRTPTNSSTPPNPPPWSGVTTNVAGYTTVATCPSPVPAGLVTNTTPHDSYSLPSPIPAGLVTNIEPRVTTWFPAAGTYVPPVNKIGSFYYYNRITGYEWNTYTYTYPNYSYAYNLYQTNAIYTTNLYDHVINSGDYYATAMTGSTIVMGDARLVLPNGLKMSGNDMVTVAPGARIKVYSDGPVLTIGGNGVINEDGYAGSFQLFATTNCTTFTLNGNGEFTGVLVAPNASLTMNGGGSSDEDFIGALMVDTVRMNGHFKFHYDEALARMSANGRLLVTSWDEIP